jgi:hypothetical protein
MAQATLNKRDLKVALKEVLVETLRENREYFHEVFSEVLEDFALGEAIREGRKTKLVTRKVVFQALAGGQ